jgi:hypothetical protein
MSWSLVLDIILVAIAASTQAATGILGWRVTTRDLSVEKKKTYERMFATFAIVGVLATTVAAYRGGSIGQDVGAIRGTQQELGRELRKIEKNTQQPPIVNVTAPALKRSSVERVPHIHVVGIDPHPARPESPLKAEVEITNDGTADADVVTSSAIFTGELFSDQDRQRKWENSLFVKNVQDVPLSFGMPETNTVPERATRFLSIVLPWAAWKGQRDTREPGHQYVVYFMENSRYRSHGAPAFVRVTEFCKYFTEDGQHIVQCHDHNLEPR